MFLHGLSSLMFWLLLVMALFAVMRWPTGDGRRPHPYPGYGVPGPYDQPSRGPLRPAGVDHGRRRREHET
jgi:hypothetical protein